MAEKHKRKRPFPVRKPGARHLSGQAANEANEDSLEAQIAEHMDDIIPNSLPVVPVRDVVVFNYMILPLFIGREKSVKAVEAALERGRKVLVVTQRAEDNDDPGAQDLYETGTVVRIMRVLKMPDSRLKILAQGVARAKIEKFTHEEPYLEARIRPVREFQPDPDSATVEALLRSVREQSERVLSMRGQANPDILHILQTVDDPGRLADIIASNMRIRTQTAQEILEAEDTLKRLAIVNELLSHELEIASVQAKIHGAAREGMDKAQREYYLREQIKAIRHELGEEEEKVGNEIADIKKKLKDAHLNQEARQEADRLLKRLSSMHGDSAEASLIYNYLEWLADLPWKKFSKDRLNITEAKKILDEDHCGLDKAKDRILEFLSVRKLNPNSKGSILCFSGPPGVGKTSLGKSIARAMNRKFQRISLGGVRDEAEIRGHRRTYVGAMPGRIIQTIKQAATRNPVIVLDEVDKLGNDFRGDPSSALLEALDPEQNRAFSDHFLNVPFNLSKVMFICTANHMDTVPAALRDRMEVINISGYTEQEKLEIARLHLLPRQIKETGLSPEEVTIGDDVITRVIREYTREAGVRNLERELGAICRKLARKRAEGEEGAFTVAGADVPDFLGPPKFVEDEKEKELGEGMALGLAWTPAGGEVLSVEANASKGRGHLILTGQLGDVMKESAQAALSYIRSHADELGIDETFATRKDIHVHVPAGATPKDGPSAGITLTTALISALSGQKARADLCMTGEITLQGRVLPVGGIKEKILAGVARGLKHVIIPFQNIRDLDDVPANLRDKIEVHPVRHYDEVRPLVFAKKRTRKKKAEQTDQA